MTTAIKKKAIKTTFQILPKIPQRLSVFLINTFVPTIKERKIANLEQIINLERRFYQNTNRNCQEKLLENFILKGMIENN